MTANAFKEDIDNCPDSEMNGHIAKPIEMDLFFGLLEKYLKQGKRKNEQKNYLN